MPELASGPQCSERPLGLELELRHEPGIAVDWALDRTAALLSR